MTDSVQHNNTAIYLAPLQGFTDFVYRKAYAEIFQGVEAFFIPYISVKNNQVLMKHEKEILPENNPQTRVIPQVLAGTADEMLFLSGFLKDKGHDEINLNLGCPYPMITNRGKGAGLLPYPDKIKELLTSFFEKTDLQLSVKLRAGLNSANEIEQIIPVLNEFPLKEVIFHPRIAKQMYEGDVKDSAFQFAENHLKHRLVYNGDIFSVDDFKNKQQLFPQTAHWMLGRGVLMNPFLPAEINNIEIPDKVKLEKLKEFHQLVFKYYFESMDNEGNVLNKMKQFWIYFSFNFTNQHKVLKTIKKTNNLNRYKSEVQKIII
jgi:tRNA-dihydrouridine synthase B